MGIIAIVSINLALKGYFESKSYRGTFVRKRNRFKVYSSKITEIFTEKLTTDKKPF